MPTAVLIPFPVLSPLVDPFRATLDRSAVWGVPPHITILYPFVPDLTPDVLTRLGEVLAPISAFDVDFASVKWFRDDLVWVAPADDAPFRTLMAALWAVFPDYPPYGGFQDPTPHVTIGHSTDLEVLRTAESAVATGLPVHGRVESVAVMAGSTEPGSWHTIASLPLSGAA